MRRANRSKLKPRNQATGNLSRVGYNPFRREATKPTNAKYQKHGTKNNSSIGARFAEGSPTRTEVRLVRRPNILAHPLNPTGEWAPVIWHGRPEQNHPASVLRWNCPRGEVSAEEVGTMVLGQQMLWTWRRHRLPWQL
jgi:hypothetical protein